jgi:hypothetical protein
VHPESFDVVLLTNPEIEVCGTLHIMERFRVSVQLLSIRKKRPFSVNYHVFKANIRALGNKPGRSKWSTVSETASQVTHVPD